MLVRLIGKNALALGLFALVTAGIVVMTHALTRHQILEKQEAVLIASLTEVMPEHYYDTNILKTTVSVQSPLLGSTSQQTAYLATKNGEPSGIILPVTAPEGYGGAIHLLVGIDALGVITGVRVVGSHSETPGLGDKIELRKSDWIRNFEGKSLTDPGASGWEVKKDGGTFDAFTGATITPRAVVSAVHDSLRYFYQNKAQLLVLAQRAGEPSNTEDGIIHNGRDDPATTETETETVAPE